MVTLEASSSPVWKSLGLNNPTSLENGEGWGSSHKGKKNLNLEGFRLKTQSRLLEFLKGKKEASTQEGKLTM